jgi:hypothetical protein
MDIHWHIITDDIMEQIELKQMIPEGKYTCSIIPPSTEIFPPDKSVCTIINVHAQSFDVLTYLQSFLNEHSSSDSEIIVYTSEKHDHQTTHAMKALGIKHMCTKDQLLTFLKSINEKQQN